MESWRGFTSGDWAAVLLAGGVCVLSFTWVIWDVIVVG